MKFKFLAFISFVFILLNTGTLLYGTGSGNAGKSEMKSGDTGEQKKTEVRYAEIDEIENINGKIYMRDEKELFTGIIVRRYNNGNVEAEYNIENGLREGKSKSFYRNGIVKAEFNYINGKLEGTAKEFFENGNIESLVEYRDNLLEGTAVFYYETGEIEVKAEYRNGLLNGELIEYDKDGRIVRETVYENDRNIKTRKAKIYDERILEKKVFRLFIGTVMLLLSISLIKIFKGFPDIKYLNNEKKEEILRLFMKYNENRTDLCLASTVYGTGETYYTVSKFEAEGRQIFIYAKIFVLFWLPTPYIEGYLAGYNKNQIISSVSRKTFKKIKEEIIEKIL